MSIKRPFTFFNFLITNSLICPQGFIEVICVVFDYAKKKSLKKCFHSSYLEEIEFQRLAK